MTVNPPRVANLGPLAWFGLALMALAYQMPGHFFPWDSFQSQWIAALAAVVLGGAALMAAPGQAAAWACPRLAVLLVAMAAVPWLQWAAGKVWFMSDALVPSAYFAGAAAAMLASSLMQARWGRAWYDGLFAAIIAGAAVAVALAWMQWLRVGGLGWLLVPLPPGGQPFSNLGQPNHLATLAALGVIGAWRAYERRHLGGLSASILLAWLGSGMVMTQSRTGWVVTLTMGLWWLLFRQRAGLRTTGRAVATAIALWLVAVLAWGPLNDALFLSAGPQLSQRFDTGLRPALWYTMARAVVEAPWIGYGWNQVIWAHQAIAPLVPWVGRPINSAHNLQLDLAVSMGVPLALILVGGLAAWFVRRWNSANPDAWAVLLAVLAVSIHAQFEFPLDYAYFLFPLAFLMGALPRAEHGSTANVLRARLVLGAMVSAMLVLLLGVGAEYLRVERAQQDARLHLAGVDAHLPERFQPPDVYLLDAPRAYHQLMMSPAHEGMSAAAIDQMRAAVARHPFPPALLRWALAAGLNGLPDEAHLALFRLCAMHTVERCEEGRTAWAAAQKRWPVLRSVSMPALPKPNGSD